MTQVRWYGKMKGGQGFASVIAIESELGKLLEFIDRSVFND
ncbi:MAG: hypothetical protein OSA89_06350 [Mariniblastus sp.]|nr:hypothetical protein [Mariniblastus sp.]